MHSRHNTAPGAEGLVDYFDQTYVSGTFRRGGVPRDVVDGAAIVRMRRIPPRYPPALWNVHQATMDDEPRTNNQCEGWNNRFTHWLPASLCMDHDRCIEERRCSGLLALISPKIKTVNLQRRGLGLNIRTCRSICVNCVKIVQPAGRPFPNYYTVEACEPR